LDSEDERAPPRMARVVATKTEGSGPQATLNLDGKRGEEEDELASFIPPPLNSSPEGTKAEVSPALYSFRL